MVYVPWRHTVDLTLFPAVGLAWNAQAVNSSFFHCLFSYSCFLFKLLEVLALLADLAIDMFVELLEKVSVLVQMKRDRFLA